MHLMAIIELLWRYTCRPRSSELRDALWGQDRGNSEMQLAPEIEWVGRCTQRQTLSELRDTLGGHDWASFETHLEAEIEWTQRWNWRPWLNEFGHELGGRDRVHSEIHLVAVIERGWKCSRPWLIEIGGVLGGGGSGSRRDGSWDSIHWLTRNCGNVENWVQGAPRETRLAGSRRLWILGWCSTQSML